MSNSTIKQLTVYRKSCFIKRSGTVSLNKGRHNIVLDTLANTIDSSTLSVSLQEGIKGSNVQVELLDTEKQEEITKEINLKLSKVENMIDIKTNQIEMWKANSDFSNHNTFDISQMSKFIEELPSKLETIYDEIEKLNEEKKDLTKKLEEKIKEANIYQIKLDVDVDQDGDYKYELAYKDNNAYWYPTYEIHTNENDQISILMKAAIYQNTNEDMKDVKIRLLSGNPSLSSDLPVLSPTYLNFFEQNNYVGMASAQRKFSRVGEEALADYAEPQEELSEVRSVVAEAKMDDTMMEYELQGNWDLYHNKQISALLEERKVDCKYHVISIPKLDDNAYLAAQVNTSDIENILRTNATIYHKGTYIGEIYLDPDYNNEKCDISLGKDESIKVKRTQKRKYTSNVLLKGQKKTEYEYEINITSSKNDKCLVTLIDQIPISWDKSIVVDVDNVSNATLDEKTGQLSWEFELEPKQNKIFNTSYSISWPKDKRINV